MNTKSERKKQMDTLMAEVDARNTNLKKVMKSSDVVFEDLMKLTGDLDSQAEFLGNITVRIDDKFPLGTTLCLDWLIDHFVAYEFERSAHAWSNEIYETLKERGHTYLNPCEYFNDNEAFYIPHATKKIYVCGKTYNERPRYLVIDDLGESGFIGNFYVRWVWKKTKLNSIGGVQQPTLSLYRKNDFSLRHADTKGALYGDCRDVGHILTYELVTFKGDGHGKADSAMYTINDIIHWFFEVNCLHTELTE